MTRYYIYSTYLDHKSNNIGKLLQTEIYQFNVLINFLFFRRHHLFHKRSDLMFPFDENWYKKEFS